MKTVLSLQELDLKIEKCRLREIEIPKQKGKFDVQKKRLAAELDERERELTKLQLEQRECESEVAQKQVQITKYEQQLLGVKKNDEYQALLHEIDLQKKQIGQKEERIISVLVEIDAAKERLAEDKKRIEAERTVIDGQCAEIDRELEEAIVARAGLEKQRATFEAQVDPRLLTRYKRIRANKKTGPAVVPLSGNNCTGCHMAVTAQVVNEILAGMIHACAHCGRLLYHSDNFEEDNARIASQ